jgi:hypothetical protein
MILLLLAYLYKFQVKPHLSKLGIIAKRPHFGLALQPVEVKPFALSNMSPVDYI